MDLKKNIHRFKIVDSTMNIASNFADKGCPNYTVVIAEKQSSGCGRMMRPWLSDIGGIYFSIIIRPSIPVCLNAYIGFSAAIAIANTVKDLFGINVQLKWPNDILVKSRKICGILSRIKINKDKIVYANIGVGLNVNNKPSLIEPNAISISEILGYKAKTHEILSTFLKYFHIKISNLKTKNIIEEWKQLNVTLGKLVKIVTLKDQIKGLAINLNSKGSLEILLNDGSIKTIVYGDCFHF